jgi:hypothetical protein
MNIQIFYVFLVGGSAVMTDTSAFIIDIDVTSHSGDQVKKTEMGRTCGTYGGEERCIQGFSG